MDAETRREIVTFPETEPLTMEGDLAAAMVVGIDRFLIRELEYVAARREMYWAPDFSSHEGYMESVEPNRQRLREMIGLIDSREAVELQLTAPAVATGPEVGSGTGYQILEVRWNVLRGVDGEGLLLLPEGEPAGSVIALPDCDVTPEMLVGLSPGVEVESHFARRLAENGYRVLVPLLIDRHDTYSGIPGLHMTNQPHREFIYRAAFQMGRHIIGYEVQKVLAAVDLFSSDANPIGVFGYGEGGLVALYAAAVDTRIQAVCVSGYFQPREGLWGEPIYRNIFGLLQEFGDAELTRLVAPRALVVEACRHPDVAGQPPPSGERAGGARGQLCTPPMDAVEAEWSRALKLTSELQPSVPFALVSNSDGGGAPGSDTSLGTFAHTLSRQENLRPSGDLPVRIREGVNTTVRFKRQFDQLVEHTQQCMREGEFRRAEYWSKADDSSLETWVQSTRSYRQRFWEEIIGPLAPASLPFNPRTRLIYETCDFKGYEVVLDVHPDVFAYGILLVPKGIKNGEHRPVVVCQHGLEGRPQEMADPKVDDPYYHRCASRLAERGFVIYAPQNPYIGGDAFRVLQRKANPLKRSLFSFIVRQHEQTLDWLASLPFVDPKRIAFYGLSYGGKTAMRVPAIVERYCLSICSADYSEWIWKTVSAKHRYSYLISGEYEIPEFNLGNTFNHAEMSWLILPRPFMVERGHHDDVGPDEWVSYEYARTRRLYVLLGIGDRTEIEFFDGPHMIHGVGTFEFLHRHLGL